MESKISLFDEMQKKSVKLHVVNYFTILVCVTVAFITLKQLPFTPGCIYNRRKNIHAVYVGNWQSGICPSANYPFSYSDLKNIKLSQVYFWKCIVGNYIV
ncbi:hypothetical protein SAMN04487935_0551 [Flavobacterium noncentrifugens]|uniref:Uncharacterized protein n=1 Tax=Flavobacterium noncentrifugens TaxID=1128970 RepID=A0A1G8SGP9_9FLAO|nr:hypothetical protein SAMN04487935_0551 [Flavobacterium noncentrifugens]